MPESLEILAQQIIDQMKQMVELQMNHTEAIEILSSMHADLVARVRGLEDTSP